MTATVNTNYGLESIPLGHYPPLSGDTSNNAALSASSIWSGVNNANFAASPQPDFFRMLMTMLNPDLMSCIMFSNTLNDFDKFLLNPFTFNTRFNTKTNLPALKNVYNPELANSLANIANQNAARTDTVGKCYKTVKDTLKRANLNNGEIAGGSAFQADGILSKHKNFKEVAVSRGDLKNLPAGCVVVWQASAGHPHGHIAVTLGDGKEASDHIQNIAVRNADFSVFVPVKKN
ncbi:MAG: hypothetical protein WCY19_01560 [Candidatus Gastranaerophilaceae bacterium]